MKKQWYLLRNLNKERGNVRNVNVLGEIINAIKMTLDSERFGGNFCDASKKWLSESKLLLYIQGKRSR